ncbi:hypothetical protein H9C73_14970 [Marinobacterium sp. AK62]|uniref:SPOR domain-containing protein n=1 Tax=Marinobacterium alkalitolerans TaxID=1542925 RepID=A0ABS3ZE96_9GAMM|nr:hypothetical protein [Marinobacterium alkalitolerans]MBP0050029.1 hypothetical protein [Marinobacterium alkalitolerans]
MLRWLALLLVLANALLLFWFGQQQQQDAQVKVPDELTRLRLLHELGPDKALEARSLQCYRLGSFMTEAEIARAGERLEARGFEVNTIPATPSVIGYRLRVPVPPDADARIRLLDELALAGWVPQTRDGYFILGPFVGEQAEAEARTEQQALVSVLGMEVKRVPMEDPNPGLDLIAAMPEGEDFVPLLQQMMRAGWPGIKIEKKSCEGLAQPQSDQ